MWLYVRHAGCCSDWLGLCYPNPKTLSDLTRAAALDGLAAVGSHHRDMAKLFTCTWAMCSAHLMVPQNPVTQPNPVAAHNPKPSSARTRRQQRQRTHPTSSHTSAPSNPQPTLVMHPNAHHPIQWLHAPPAVQQSGWLARRLCAHRSAHEAAAAAGSSWCHPRVELSTCDCHV